MPTGEYRPCRLIRGYSTPALGIFDIPCGTIEDARREGSHLSENPKDFRENFTVVRWFEEPVDGREYEAVPEDIVSFLKQGMVS